MRQADCAWCGPSVGNNHFARYCPWLEPGKKKPKGELQVIIDRAIPIYAMGGLSGAMYRADDPEDVDGYAVDVRDWNRLKELVME